MAKILKWIMVLWTLFLLGSCFMGLADVGQLTDDASSESERTAVGVGGTIGVFLFWIIWGVGIVPMGIMAMVFRKKGD